MTKLKDCFPGDCIKVFCSCSKKDYLADFDSTSAHTLDATYLGYYPENIQSPDQYLIGWRHAEPVFLLVKDIPDIFAKSPLVSNPDDYKWFRWCSGFRLVELGSIVNKSNFAHSNSIPGQLSPVSADGWHECKCGFRNQFISISAFISGKYVCYSCRNVWK